MKYLDSGARDPSQALGHWLEGVLADEDVSEVRWQSGFYTADGLGFLAPTLDRIRREGGRVTALVGSNNGDTLRADVERLLPLLGIPRPGAFLGVVSYAGAFFHPKTYHLTRRDGTQAAYVGSANLTSAGVGSLHVEAGVVLDTRDGDDFGELSRIAAAADDWFDGEGRAGLTVVDGPGLVARLVAEGVLAEAPPLRAQNEAGAGTAGAGPGRPRLLHLLRVPPWGVPAPGARAHGAAPAAPPVPPRAAATRPSSARPDLPEYLRFDLSAQAPTTGTDALTGAPLPGGAVGLVLRLNRDSARHFAGGKGTANVSIPVDTLTTIRFGVYREKYERPRAEFDLRARYVGASRTFNIEPLDTNIMAYGFVEREPGHRDVRMLIPAAIRALADKAKRAGLPVPANDDVALLEWPTETAPEFRITYIERGSPLFKSAQTLFDAAAAAGTLVGDGACWLPVGVASAW